MRRVVRCEKKSYGKELTRRSWIPQIIAAKEPLKANQLLLPYLTDADPDVRVTCITALSPAMAAPPEIESVTGLLDDPDKFSFPF